MSESEGTYSVWTASALIFNAVVGMGIWTVPKESGFYHSTILLRIVSF